MGIWKALNCNGNEKEAGQGCGHNLLGIASAAAAALALRHVLDKEKIEGQVVFYGCPAEETLKGKNVMAGNGCFRELDAALSWHPSDGMNPGEISYSAMDSIQFTFLGKSSHAAAKPHIGRSSLDAVELPNIVPEKSKVWYFSVPAAAQKQMAEKIKSCFRKASQNDPKR